MEFRTFSKLKIHQAFYKQLKEEFPSAPAQYLIRAIANVASDMKREKKLHRYRPTGALKLDARLYSIKGDELSVRLAYSRVKIKMALTGFDRYVRSKLGAAEIIYDRSNKKMFINFSYEQEVVEMVAPVNAIGVDKGIVNIATTSTGRNFSGERVEKVRRRYLGLRKSLQKRGTRSAKRKLVKVSKKESRFRADVNHQISKQLVNEAKGTDSAIILEDLKGITKRTTVSKEQRARHTGWSFYQLDSFIAYKAERAGVSVVFVDPAYTSQQCPKCGNTTRKNRKVRDVFKCIECGYCEDADKVGAENIRRLGVDLLGLCVNHPNVAAD